MRSKAGAGMFMALVITLMAVSGFAAQSACDLNNDGQVNAADVQIEANEVFENTPCVNDLNQDGACTILDVQLLVNAVLTGTCSATVVATATPAIPTTGAY